MPQVSKRKINDEVYEKVFDVFLETILQVRNKNQLVRFLKEYLTPTEQIMLSKRLAIAYLLSKNYDYRQISSLLKVSTATVRSVSLIYKNGSVLKGFVDKSVRNDRLNERLEDLAEVITGVLGTGTKGKTWRVVRDEIREAKKRRL